MIMTPHITRRLVLAGLGLFLAAVQLAHAAEIRVITSGAVSYTHLTLPTKRIV